MWFVKFLLDSLSRDPLNVFDDKELDKFNTATMLPGNSFLAVSASSPDIHTLVLDAQKSLDFGSTLFADLSINHLPRKHRAYSLKDNVIFYKGVVWVSNHTIQVQVIKYFHEHILSGHPGFYKTAKLISKTYNWKKMDALIREVVAGCLVCARSKPIKQKPMENCYPFNYPISHGLL